MPAPPAITPVPRPAKPVRPFILAGALLALALPACDGIGPAEPVQPQQNVAPAFGEVWFVSSPPNPAYAGTTYEVHAEAAMGTAVLSSLTPEVCSFASSQVASPAALTLLAAGTCTVNALCPTCPYTIDEVQTFEVTEWTAGTPPVTPGEPPVQREPGERGAPTGPAVPRGPSR